MSGIKLGSIVKKNTIEKQVKNYYLYNITNQIEKTTTAIESMNNQSFLATVGMESLSTVIGGTLIPALANLAITAASDFIYNITHSAEIAQQKMEETARVVLELQGNINSLNENLNTTIERINSLMAQNTLSIVDQQELQLLQQQNSELEHQIEIKRQLSSLQEKELAQSTVEAFKENYGKTNLNFSENAIKDYKDKFGTKDLSFLYDLSSINDINAMIAALDILKEKQNSLDENDGEGISALDTLTEDFWAELDKLEVYRSQLSSISSDLLTIEQTKIITTLDSVISQSMEYLDPTYNIDKKINGIFAQKNFAYLKENLIAAAKQGDGSLESMINNTAGLKDALASVNLTTDDLKGHIVGLADASNQSLSVLKGSLSEAFQPTSDSGKGGAPDQLAEFNDWLSTLDDSQLKLLYEISVDTDTAKLTLSDWQAMLEKAEAQAISFESVSNVLNGATADMDNLNAAMASSFSGKGVSSQQIKSIMEMFKDMDGFDPSRLFEKTASGLHLNTDELKNLQKQYEALTKQQFMEDLAKKQQELNRLTSQGIHNDYTDKLSEEISQIKLLQSQYEGLTSAYNKWLTAQSTGEKGDTYDSVAGTMLQRGKELYEQGLIGTNEFAAITQFMSSEDLTNKTPQEIAQVYKDKNEKMQEYYTQDRTGVDNFLNDVVENNLGQWKIETNDSGQEIARSFEFVSDAGKELADTFKLSAEFFDYIAQKASDYGIENNYDSENYNRNTSRSYNSPKYNENQENDALDEANRLRKRAANAYTTMTVSADNAAEYIDYLDQLKEIPEEVRTQAYLDINQPENAFLDLDAMYADYEAAISTLNDVDATQQAKRSALSTINTIANILATTPEVKFPVDFDLTNLSPEQIQQALLSGVTAKIPAEVVADTTTGASEVNSFVNQSESSTVMVSVGANMAPAIASVAAWNPGSKFINIFTRYIDNTGGGTGDGYGNYGGNQVASVDGTAHALASGSLHMDYLRSQHPFIYGAYAGGNWGLPHSQTALVGELAPEMLVRNGRWQLIGQRGAQFMGLKRGDIVFNHRQTRQLLENGWVTGRGRAIGFNSHVMGTVNSMNHAFAEGTAAQFQNKDYADTPITSTMKQIKEASEDFCEAMDYISIALDQMTKSIEHNKSLADLFQTYRDQNPELDKAAAQLTEKQKFSQRAYDRYMAQADASGLSPEYRSQIQNGSLDISNITDETLKAQIDEYQKWYEKAQDVRDEIIDIGQELRDINLQKLENITDDFDRVISYKNSLLDVMETINELNQLKGIATTESDLTEQMNAQADISGYYAGEVERLTAEFEALVSSGVIVEYSDDWYEWNETIQETKNSLLDSNKALLELKNDIMELRLQPFDEAIDKIEALEDQISDMDDLINDNAIFSENGTFTNAGITRIGLMGQQLAASRQKAAEYANAIADLKANLSNGNITQDKYNELLKDYTSGQSNAVSATKKAMDAIIDLVKDGIDKEADAYGRLIDAKKKDLQATRDYQDYVDDLNDKQSKINAKEAQIAAMEGDETKAQQLRKLKKELDELKKDYDKAVDDHSFDAAIQGYDDAKQAFEDNAENARNELDTNFEAQQQAIQQTLDIAKDNYSEVYAYIGTLADVYGAALTEDIINPWTSAQSAVESYKSAVEQATAQTTINTAPIHVAENPATDTAPSDERGSSSIIAPIVNPPAPQETPQDTNTNNNNIFNGIPESPTTKGAGWLARNTSINDRLYWNGYAGGYGNQQILYNNLNGASVHGGYAGSMAQNMWLLEQLKSRGFRRGGIVDVDPAFALGASGEKVLAMARPGEYILTQQQTGLFSAFMEKLPALDKLMSAPSLLGGAVSESTAPVTIHVGSMIGTVGTLEKQALPELEVILNRACDKFENRLRQEFKRPQFGGIRR